MSQYLLINRIQVQGANAIAGFTWGFPAITHFLGFVHNLSRKLVRHESFTDIQLTGCAVIAHQHQVHTYAFNQFVQNRTPAFQYKEQSKYKVGSPPVIEEGKMNMTVSLLIDYEGNIGHQQEQLKDWLDNHCPLQHLAGGTILNIEDITFFTIDNEQNKGNLRSLIRKLLPGFILLNRPSYLESHFQQLQAKKPEAELFDAWLDFIALKQKARPGYQLINRHLIKQTELQPRNEQYQELLSLLQIHLEHPYSQDDIPDDLKKYFASIADNKTNKQLLQQWQDYCAPTEKTDAVWEYVKKPEQGFLVPIMVGYKAISPVYKNHEVANTRDNETDVCFVEAVHSIGEWQGVHRIRDDETLKQSMWQYHYENYWYLCKQNIENANGKDEISLESPDDDFS